MRQNLFPVFCALSLLAACGDTIVESVNKPPTVSILSPLDRAEFVTGDGVEVTAVIKDSDNTNDELTVNTIDDLDGVLQGGHPDAAGNFTFSFTPTEGAHLLTVLVSDPDGAEGQESITFEVRPPNPNTLDGDGDGFAPIDGDCDDGDASINPNAIETCNAVDDDCDGVIDNGFDADGDGFTTCGGDCNDNEVTVYPNAAESCNGLDDDCDGAIDEGFDQDGDGVNLCAGDCNDLDPTVFPGAAELCNTLDDNCNGLVDEGLSTDSDGDGHAAPGSCSSPADDCDDSSSLIYPGAPERCNGVDDDCDSVVPPNELDGDGDGFRLCDGDCDDTNPNRNPGLPELCNNIDDNCDGQIDEGLDADGDGYLPCNGDCDDNDAATHPGAGEICDGKDNNCDALIPPGEVDLDGDGFFGCGVDCDDNNPFISPSATEICNSVDDNCDGSIDEGFDGDADGYTSCGGDCNDADGNVHPGATEQCNGLDDDCDGILPVDEADNDSDGFTVCGGDCNDTTALINPGAPEACNGLDDDCDGTVDNGFDADGDGFTSCGGDCDDNSPIVYPGAPEQCNAADDDCDGVVPADEFDGDGDGFRGCNGDCDDTNASVNPLGIELCNGLDDNCNGTIDEGFDGDGDGVSACAGDCNDSDPTIYPGSLELCDGIDNNCDTIIPPNELDNDLDGYRVCDGDCNDGAPMIHPNAVEVCDSIDNNCDGVADEGLSIDADGDGHTLPGSCQGPADDCDDADVNTYFGAIELCDGIDNNCDNVVPANEADLDGDTVRVCAGDCDDTNPSVSPVAQEICDGIDNNCDTIIDEGFDLDLDGVTTCQGDCNDADATTFPGAPELCDGADNNCDAIVPANEADADLDGVRVCSGDCDDTDPSVKPGAPELCDGLDNNCDGTVDEGFDSDGDGMSPCAGDCNDLDPTIYTGAPELCDGVDNDCDFVVPANEVDGDSDTYRVCAGDCNDADPAIHPGAFELCDGLDNNCDGFVDEVCPVCGNGVVDAGESCDNGPFNSDTIADACRTNCSFASCGDGVVDSGETCDDGNTVPGDGCDANCAVEPCVLAGPTSGVITAAMSPCWVQSKVTVPSAQTLEIQAGVVLKFSVNRSWAQYDIDLQVDGHLLVGGTQLQPVVFTSYYDDTAGGDMNGDAGLTSPLPGDWGRVRVAGTGTADLSWLDIRYGGGGQAAVCCSDFATDAALSINLGQAPPMNNITVQDSLGRGVYVTTVGGFATNLANFTLLNNTGNGLEFVGGNASLSLSNIIASGNGNSGIVTNNTGATTLTTITTDSNGLTGVQATATNGITATGLSAALNSSMGLDLYSGAGPVSVDISTATDNVSGGIRAIAGATLDLSNGIFDRNGGFGISLSTPGVITCLGNTAMDSPTGYGLDVAAGSSLSTIRTNQLTGNFVQVHTVPGLVEEIVNNNTILNTQRGIVLYGGLVDILTVWPDPGYVYRVENTITVTALGSLTINPGVVLKFHENRSWAQYDRNFLVDGNLDVAGALGNPVIFSSYLDDTAGGDTNLDGVATSPLAGDWGRVRYNVGATGSVQYAEMRFGGGGQAAVCCSDFATDATLSSQGSLAPVLDNILVEDSLGAGMHVSVTGGFLTSITNTTVSRSALSGLNIEVGPAALALTNVSALAGNGVGVSMAATGDVTLTDVLADGNASMGTNGSVGGNLLATRLTGTNNGSDGANLNVTGTVSIPDYLGSNNSGSGGYFVAGGALDVVLASTNNNLVDGLVVSTPAALLVDQVSSLNNTGVGLVVLNSGLPASITNTSLTGNDRVARAAPNAVGRVLDPTNVLANTVKGLWIVGGTVSGSLTWPAPPGFEYVVEGTVTVASGVTLAVDPNTVLKFVPNRSWAQYDSNFIVDGTLNLNGLPGAPIVLSSFWDDTAGGDTNQDGVLTTPLPGDWGRLRINVGATANISYMEARYGGGGQAAVCCSDFSTDAIFSVASASANVTASIIEYSLAAGAFITGGTGNLTSSTFRNNATWGLQFSDPTTCLNWGQTSLAFIANTSGGTTGC